MEIVEDTKKAYLNQKSTVQSPIVENSGSDEEDGGNPFGSDQDDEDEKPKSHLTQKRILPNWLLEAPEEIDVLLAQRDFVKAQKLLKKSEKVLRAEFDNVQCDTLHRIGEKREEIVQGIREKFQKIIVAK